MSNLPKAISWRCCINLIAIATSFLTTFSHVEADYFLTTFYGFDRYSSSGELQHHKNHLGESVNGMALGPDGYIYFATNDLGNGSIYRVNPETNELVDGYYEYGDPVPWLGGDFCNDNYCSGIRYDAPGQLTFGPYGDLFAISYNYYSPSNEPRELRVLQIDGASAEIEAVLSGAIQSPYVPPNFLQFTDIAAGLNSDIFVALSNGQIQHHEITQNGSTLLATLNTGLDGLNWMAIGRDGLLYLRDEDSNSIVRFDPYNSTAETFIPSIPLINAGDWVGDIFFGDDGDLFVINPGYSLENRDSRLLRFDGQTGEYMGVVITASTDSLTSFGVFVPEASLTGLLISSVLGGGLLVRPLRKVRQ